MDVQPFKIEVPDAVLEDLRERLARTRWPDEIPGSGWDYGANLAHMKELMEYWRTGFDWRAQEKALNSYSHFRANVDGMGIHFIHERGKGPDPMPLIITHGWPGSVFEELKIIPLLTDPASYGGDPADSFDLVIPSLPGYGFSDRPSQRGMSHFRVADLWAKLMTEGLGYRRFGAQGGDWGAIVTARLGYAHPDKLIGIYMTAVGGAQPYMGPGSRELSQREQEFIEEREAWRKDEGAYFHIQATKPQTLGYGLNDSPTGLAAWIVDRFRTWGKNETDEEKRRYYTRDEILTNITIYWVTQTINSANRLYYEVDHSPWNFKQGERIRVPSALALFPRDQNHPPREWGERIYNVQHWREMPEGGHFNAMEEPELLAEDIRAFFRTLRG